MNLQEITGVSMKLQEITGVFSLHLKFTGDYRNTGGLGGLHMFIALNMSFSEWAHFYLNSRRLPKYDATKLAPTRTFRGLTMGKLVRNVPKFHLKNLSSFHKMVLEPYKLAWGILREISKNV